MNRKQTKNQYHINAIIHIKKMPVIQTQIFIYNDRFEIQLRNCFTWFMYSLFEVTIFTGKCERSRQQMS